VIVVPRPDAGVSRGEQGRRARNLRAEIERTGDHQAIFLFDYISKLMERWKPPTDWEWNLTAREAVRAWCFLTGRMLLPRLKANGQRVMIEGCPTYRYGGRRVCPAELNIKDKNGTAIHFRNPTPSRRKHVNHSWVPTVEFFDPPPRLPRAKRVRRTDRGATDLSDALARALATCSSSLAGRSEAGSPVEGTKLHSRTNLECSPESAPCLENPAAAAAPLNRDSSVAASGDRGPVERTIIYGQNEAGM